jgi:hypothetical protein
MLGAIVTIVAEVTKAGPVDAHTSAGTVVQAVKADVSIVS